MLVIVDISSPTNPKTVGSYNVVRYDYGVGYDVQVLGDYAYIASNSGLVIINVSNPQNMKVTTTFDTNGYAMGVYTQGHNVYIADNKNGLVITKTLPL